MFEAEVGCAVGSWSAIGELRVIVLTPGPLAHRVEQGTFNPQVLGSSPRRPTDDQASDGRAPSESDRNDEGHVS